MTTAGSNQYMEGMMRQHFGAKNMGGLNQEDFDLVTNAALSLAFNTGDVFLNNKLLSIQDCQSEIYWIKQSDLDIASETSGYLSNEEREVLAIEASPEYVILELEKAMADCFSKENINRLQLLNSLATKCAIIRKLSFNLEELKASALEANALQAAGF
jgi:hypothetical protein